MASDITAPQLQALFTLPTNHRVSIAPYLLLQQSNTSDRQHLPICYHSKSLNLVAPLTPSDSPSESPSTRILPHLTLTYATSLDSSIALAPGLETVISGPETKAMTHYLRAVHDAILVGANTAIIDDPSLKCRHVYLDEATTRAGTGTDMGMVQLKQQPVPVILDPSAKWMAPLGCKVLKLAREGGGKGVFWVVGREEVEDGDWDENEVKDAVRRVRDTGGETVFAGSGLRSEDGGVEWRFLLELLAKRGIRSMMVEGGATVIMDLLKEKNQKLVGSVIITMAPVWFGEGGVTVCPPRKEIGIEAGRLMNVKWLQMGEDVVMAGKFPNGSLK